MRVLGYCLQCSAVKNQNFEGIVSEEVLNAGK